MRREPAARGAAVCEHVDRMMITNGKFKEASHVTILGCEVDRVTLGQAVDRIEDWIAERRPNRCRFVVATGFHGIWEAHKSEAFRKVLNSADLFCPDGIAPVWLSKLRYDPLPERVPGPDLLAEFLSRSDRAGYRSFFLGDTEETLEALRHRVESLYPRHQVAGLYSPPFKPLDGAVDVALVETINAAKPDILWVGLGLPKQEWWIYKHRQLLRVPVAVAVGAAFGFISGRIRRAPRLIGRMGFEWTWRLMMEPGKLWRRDLIEGPRFLARALQEYATLSRTDTN